MYEGLGTFAPLWAEWMKAYQPKEFERLQESGRAGRLAAKFQKRALLAFQSCVIELKRANPGPATFMEAVQHYENLRAMAREQVLADLLPTPSDSTEDEPEMTVGEADEILRQFFGTIRRHDESS